MTVYMPVYNMSPDSMIAVFQAIAFPVEVRQKQSLFSCLGPVTAKLHFVMLCQ